MTNKAFRKYYLYHKALLSYSLYYLSEWWQGFVLDKMLVLSYPLLYTIT
jgi:hypothetical protein